MAVATAEQLKAALAPPIFVSVPGHPDLEIECRLPDVDVLFTRGLLALPHLQAALALRDGVVDEAATSDGTAGRALEMIDVFCIHAAVRPRIVATAAEAADGQAIHVELLPLALRLKIVAALKPTAPAVAEAEPFRGEPDGAVAGSDSTPVRAATVDAVGDGGSDPVAGS